MGDGVKGMESDRWWRGRRGDLMFEGSEKVRKMKGGGDAIFNLFLKAISRSPSLVECLCYFNVIYIK